MAGSRVRVPYVYGNDVMVLSVKERSNQSGTDRYVASLTRRLGVARTVDALALGAFVTANGSALIAQPSTTRCYWSTSRSPATVRVAVAAAR